MKKILVALAALFLTFGAFAAENEAILDKIETAGKKHSTITGALAQTKTTAAKAKIDMVGTLYFTAPKLFAIKYTKPANDRTVVNETSMLVNRKGEPKKYTLKSTPSMKNLADFLLNAMSGNVRAIAKGNNADYTISEEGGNYVIVLTARKKAAKGYSLITLTYRKSDCVMVKMETKEFNGVVNNYVLSDIKVNSTIDKGVYAI